MCRRSALCSTLMIAAVQAAPHLDCQLALLIFRLLPGLQGSRAARIMLKPGPGQSERLHDAGTLAAVCLPLEGACHCAM